MVCHFTFAEAKSEAENQTTTCITTVVDTCTQTAGVPPFLFLGGIASGVTPQLV